MKRNFVLSCLISFLLAGFITHSAWAGSAHDNLIKESIQTEIATVADKIPEKVLNKFESKFIYDKNKNLRGAPIGMLTSYLNADEIQELVRSYIKANAYSLFMEYKPKGDDGCKKNNKWACIIIG